jgi:hypothetical protein
LRGGARVTEESLAQTHEFDIDPNSTDRWEEPTSELAYLREEVEGLRVALKEARDNPTRVCPGCGRTIGLVIGDHTMRGGMPLCHEAHVRASLLEEAERRAEAAEAQAAQAREAGYREAVEDAIKFVSDYTVAQDDFYKAGMLFAEDLREALLTAPETPAGVEEIGETCNETEGNRPFVWVMEAGEYRLIHGEEGEG